MPTDTPLVAAVEADMVRMVEVLVCPLELTRLMLTLLQIAQANGLAGFEHGQGRARGAMGQPCSLPRETELQQSSAATHEAAWQ